MTKRSTRLGLAFLALLGAASSAPAAPSPRDVAQAIRSSLSELIEFVKLPNVTTRSAAEIRTNAEWLEAAFKRHGWSAQQLPDGETPMLFASFPGGSPQARTILFYAHMDGQPVRNGEWAQPDPFGPVLRRCAVVRTCETLPLARLASGPVDAEWRLFARAIADDKAPIMMMMAAVDAMRTRRAQPTVNIKFLIDSHEEGGPPTLKDVVARNAALLAADGIVILDGPMHGTNRRTLILGHRGGGVARLTVWGPSNAAHSGHYGNYAPNPAQRLAALVASLRDDAGHILVPGYDDGIDPGFAHAAIATPVPDDEAALRRQLGIASPDRAGESYRAAMARPSLNLIGLGSGSMGELDQSIVPDRAIAAFDIRTVPGIAFDREAGLVRAAVEHGGFHLVTGAPSEQDRARYPKLASFESRWLSDPLFTDPDAPLSRWARRGLDLITVPIMGGSVPTAPLVNGLHLPAVIVPLANADDNQHAPNENLRLGNFLDGVDELQSLLSQRL